MGLFGFLKKQKGGSEKEVKAAPVETEGDLAKNEPANPALYEKSLHELNNRNEGFITIFNEADNVVQVAAGGDTLYLNITTYPDSEHPDEKLKKFGIVLPEGSEFSEWEANSFAQYAVPASSVKELSEVIDSVYRKMFSAAEGYTVSIIHEV